MLSYWLLVLKRQNIRFLFATEPTFLTLPTIATFPTPQTILFKPSNSFSNPSNISKPFNSLLTKVPDISGAKDIAL
jgi:hypothetical protein